MATSMRLVAAATPTALGWVIPGFLLEAALQGAAASAEELPADLEILCAVGLDDASS